MSAEPLPAGLTRLIGQHPAALRTVRLAGSPEAFLEIETKHGRVALIRPWDGAVFSEPPLPPGTPRDAGREQEDLTEAVSVAFDDRPTIDAISRLADGSTHRAWRFTLSTGVTLVLARDEPVPITSA